MKAILTKRKLAMNISTLMNVADNSGAKLARLVSVKH